MRAPYQVLIIPYRHTASGLLFAVLRRRGNEMWQFVSGGGEDGEIPTQSAWREMEEEVSVDVEGRLLALDATASIPKCSFDESTHWDENVLVIPEHCFAVDVENASLTLSDEHDALRWCSYEQARALLTWDSNRTALWELRERLKRED